jgi:hypothetical protein
MLAGWMLWLGGILLITANRPTTVVFAHGPGAIFTAHTWAVIFLVAGSLKVIEIFVLHWKPLAATIQWSTLIPLVVWAVSWDWGPATPGQPAYTFVVLVAIAVPMISGLLNNHLDAKAERVVQEAVAVATQITEAKLADARTEGLSA